MPTTTNYAWPYPALADTPNVPRDVQALAIAVDATMAAEATARAAVNTTLLASGLGRVGGVVDATTNVTPVTAAEAILGGTATMTLTNGRRYRVSTYFAYQLSGSGAWWQVVTIRRASGGSVTTAATALFNIELTTDTRGFNATASGFTEFVHSGATGTYTFGFSCVVGSGTTNGQFGGGAAQPSIISVDDIGT